MRTLLSTLVSTGIVLSAAHAQAANFQVLDDLVYTFQLTCVNQSGASVSCPTGTTWTATCSSATACNARANGNTLIITPLVKASPGLVATVTSNNSVTTATLTFDIVTDPNLLSTFVNTAPGAYSTVGQPVPTASGP
jgi:hypothetical protein